MLSAAHSVAENSSCHVVLQRAPKGTPSSILTLRLRRCFHHRRFYRQSTSHTSPLHILPNFCRATRYLPNVKSTPGFRYATTHSSPPLSSISYDAVAHIQSLLARSDGNILRSNGPLDHAQSPNTPPNTPSRGSPIPASTPAPPTSYDTNTQFVDPFRGALLAMRERDTRAVLSQLNVIENMSREDIQDAIAALPRTTFTEFFRALDPLRVARDCDPIGETRVSIGMYQLLNMTSSIDEYGVRRLYTKLMQRLLMLMSGLQAAGYTLHLEEYISLIRCAGASSDILGAGAFWNDLSSGPLLPWRNSQLYTEYIKARFLTEPLYTNYEKTTRMVTPRNLHRSRLMLSPSVVQRLDNLRTNIRSNRLRFGLNKDIGDVQELMRALRVRGAAMRVFWTVTGYHSFRVDESLLCALMIALGRAGLLRFIGTQILQRFFAIRTPHPLPGEPESQAQGLSFGSEPPRLRPSVRLMRAVVETYGSNSEIAVALQLVEHLSNTYNIPIPRDVWQDLLEWTQLMSTPPAATAWRIAKLSIKVPGSQAVEMIWNAMTSPPYNCTSTFRNYDILIRSLIGRRVDDLTPVLSRMREAILLYDEQCREYEAAVFEYALYIRTGIAPSAITHRFERARHKKQMMWFDIMTWCQMLLKRFQISRASPVPHPLVPRFIEEFRPFLMNPVEYSTPTGRISLVDPAIDAFKAIRTGFIAQTIPMRKNREEWTRKRLLKPKLEFLSTHSLAKLKRSKFRNPLHLLAPHPMAFVAPSRGVRRPDDLDEQEVR
ncbi:mitochondrial ATPase expression-domain-containing protein [Xylaria sp. FL1777]|nr:mitochondrial ATPase expression-domain-containing protein [Xylaria sp. FL1777]